MLKNSTLICESVGKYLQYWLIKINCWSWLVSQWYRQRRGVFSGKLSPMETTKRWRNFPCFVQISKVQIDDTNECYLVELVPTILSMCSAWFATCPFAHAVWTIFTSKEFTNVFNYGIKTFRASICDKIFRAPKKSISLKKH